MQHISVFNSNIYNEQKTFYTKQKYGQNNCISYGNNRKKNIKFMRHFQKVQQMQFIYQGKIANE